MKTSDSLQVKSPSPAVSTPLIIQGAGNNKGIYIILGIAALGGGIYFGKQWYDKYKLGEESKKADTDRNANLATQIYSENRATWTSDDKQIELYRQINDYQATRTSYKNAYSLEMLEDTRQHVRSGTYQQILNILGLKGGAIKPTSQAAQNLQVDLMNYSWVVAKVDSRIRKSPKVTSAVFTTQSNIIGVANANTLIGIVDKQSLLANNKKLFYDDKNSTFFLPVFIFSRNNAKKVYKAFVAIANVNLLKEQPKGLDFFSFFEFQYNGANAF